MLVKRIAVYNATYPSIFNRLRAIYYVVRLEITTFSYHLAFNAPVEGDPLGQSSLFLVDE